MTQSLIFSVFSVFLMMLPGYILGKRKVLSEKFLKDLTKLIITFVFPCLAFTSVLKNFSLDVLVENWQLPFSSVLITFAGYFTARIFQLFYKLKSAPERSSFEYLCTFNNYIFLPLAIISQVMEPQYVAAVVISSLGTEFLVWSLGVYVMNPNGKTLSKESFKHLFSPPLIALYAAVFGLVVFKVTGWDLEILFAKVSVSKYLWNSLNTIGAATVPMTMVLAGARIAQTDTKLVRIREIWIVTALRLLIIPIVTIVLLHLAIPNNEFLIVLCIVSITPTAFNSMLLGEMFNADMNLISGTVLVSYTLSLITIPLWMLFLLH